MAGFATAEFAAHLHEGRRFAESMMADALDLRHRFRRLWARLCVGEVEGAAMVRVRVFLVSAEGTTDLGQDQLVQLIWHATTPEDACLTART